jgi:hypothetical protein
LLSLASPWAEVVVCVWSAAAARIPGKARIKAINSNNAFFFIYLSFRIDNPLCAVIFRTDVYYIPKAFEIQSHFLSRVRRFSVVFYSFYSFFVILIGQDHSPKSSFARS